MKYYCNPVNVNYRYQFNDDQRQKEIKVAREAADPSLICFKGRYYIFASMTLGVWVSDDMAHWENHRLPDGLPFYDYAPDVCVRGEYVYFCASKRGEVCNFYRTKDILNGPYEKIKGTFDFWDPHMFLDDDGRLYFYWGCSNMTPIWGVELDPETMHQIGEKRVLITGNAFSIGYERCGEDHTLLPRTEEEIDACYQGFLQAQHMTDADFPDAYKPLVKGMFSQKPYIEGAWMDKFNGKYYLQYACPGTQYNIYTDGVYVSDSPLGSFALAQNNPYSYKPGGFIPGAGHGSTMKDTDGCLWHTATMRISVNHDFERRVGIWPAGLDAEGELFCNQRYGDWPVSVEDAKKDPWCDPKWYLLSYGKSVQASSSEEGKGPEKAVDENVQTWWRAGSADPGEWICLDLGMESDVHAVQINFADDRIDIPVPGKIGGAATQPRYIEERALKTRWILEGAEDGEVYEVLADKSQADTDLTHDLIVWEEGKHLRYLKLTVKEVPYGQQPCISGLRVFGIQQKEKPEIPEFTAERIGDLDMNVKIQGSGALGYNILWGENPQKLYHSYMVFHPEQRIGALIKGRDYWVRVDAFNEAGITEGNVKHLI